MQLELERLAVTDLTLDFLNEGKRALVLKRLEAVVVFDDAHINRFMLQWRDSRRRIVARIVHLFTHLGRFSRS
jgi:hypothetical protein